MMTYEIIWDQLRYIAIIWGHLRTFSRGDASQGFILLCSNLSVPATPEGPGADSSSTVSPGLCIVNFNLCAYVILCDVFCIFLFFLVFYIFCIATRWYGAKFNPAWRSRSRLILHGLARPLHCELQSVRICDIVWCVLHFSIFPHLPGEGC